jgi:hypothetical protein
MHMHSRPALVTLGLVSFGLVPSLDGQALGHVETGLSAAEEVEPRVPLILQGIVANPGGSPAAGAVVVTSAGGKTVTDASGSYRFEVQVPADARSIQISAVGGTGGGLVANWSVDLTAGSTLTGAGPLELASASPCRPSWLPTFGGLPGTNGQAYSVAVFDDGSGPALFVGGNFGTAGGVPASRIAKWDGASWAPLGSGMNAAVYSLTVFDDGNGPALYAGGGFTVAGGVGANRIAKWDGSSWTALGSGTNDDVLALAVFDDGEGLALYGGGTFTAAGGVVANRIAKWVGASWAALDTGLNNRVTALTTFDGGGGPALHVGGVFTSAGGVAASSIARWDGTSWSAVGSGMGAAFFPDVLALIVFDDGTGPALYAGGRFTTAGGVAAIGIARWSGASWSAVGTGVGGLAQTVSALTVFDDGSGPALHAGGGFTTAGGVPANQIAKWDGSSWSALGGGLNGNSSLAVFDDGDGSALYVAGSFTIAGGMATRGMAKWDGTSWAALGSGIDAVVLTLRVLDDGSGPTLHAGGNFTTAGGVAARRVARWDGTAWAAFGSGLNSFVNALELFDGCSGPALHAGGAFSGRIARWDDSSWALLGSGTNNSVLALEDFDDGTGPLLALAGSSRTPVAWQQRTASRSGTARAGLPWRAA